MPYPNEFYYYESRQAKQYQLTPTGKPDISRLFQGDPAYWIGAGSTPHKIKKKLILADWSVLSWKENKWAQVRETLATMLDEGFTIYVWYSYDLKMLSKSDLESLIARHDMIPTSYDHVYNDTAKLGIALDETHILDDYWIDYIINPREGFYPHKVSMSAIKSRDSSISRTIDLLKKSQPPVVSLINDVYQDETYYNREYDSINGWTKEKKYTSFYSSLSYDKIKSIVDANEHDFTDVDSLILYQQDHVINSTPTNKIIELFTKCKSLELNNCRDFVFETLPTLESLKIYHQSPEYILKFLHTYDSSQLKLLDLSDFCENDDDSDDESESDDESFTASQLSLPVLEELMIGMDEFRSSYLVTLLNSAPNLKRLQIKKSEIAQNLKLTPNSLINLEVICLDFVTITPNNLLRLLAAAPNLKALYYTQGKCFDFIPTNNLSSQDASDDESESDDESDASDTVSLTQLRHVRLTGTTMDIETLDILLTMAPQLSRDDLSSQIVEYVDNSPPPTQSKKIFLDAETDVTSDLTVKQIFEPIGHRYHPPVSTYRLQVYNNITLNPLVCTIDQAFTLENNTDLNLQPCVIPQSDKEVDAALYTGSLFYGSQRLYLSNDWQALASLSPNEQMLRFNTINNHPVEIQYSTRDNLYYIKSATKGWVNIEFTLHVMDDSLKTVQLSNDDFFSKFSIEPLELDNDNKTGLDYIQAIYNQKKGSCRHRSFLFKYIKDQTHIRSRIINNDCHSFIEVYSPTQNKWQSIDLGGAEITLTIDTRNSFKRATQKQPLIMHSDDSEPTEIATNTHDIALNEQTLFEFDQQLRVWETEERPDSSVYECFAYYLSENKKRLIQCKSNETLTGLRFGLDAYCKQQEMPIFYIHSPADLKCFIMQMTQCVDDPNKFNETPIISPLSAFIIEHSAKGVLLINYSLFKADELVRWNDIVGERLIDKMSIPEGIMIVGLLDSSAAHLKPGNDFYSRFDAIESCDISLELLNVYIPQLPTTIIYSDEMSPAGHVDFFHTTDWESKLLGSWSLEIDGWQYQEGLLQHWIDESVQNIHIQNGPWENEAFCRFWQEAQLMEQLPSGVVLTKCDGYAWELLRAKFSLQPELPADEYKILNPSTLDHFLKRYIINNNQLQRSPGYIERARGQRLSVYVSRAINEHDWAMLLTHCNTYNVILDVHLGPKVNLPTALNTEAELPEAQVLTANAMLQVIESSDVDALIHELLVTLPAVVVDISACKPSDLFVRIDTDTIFDNDAKSFIFTEKPGALLHALSNGRNIILRGQCSDELVDAFASDIFFAAASTTARCIIVTENAAAFSYLTYATRNINAEDKCNIWRQLYSCTEIPAQIAPYFASEPFAKLQARYRYLQSNPEQSTDQAWSGVNHSPENLTSGLYDSISSEDFDKKRLHEVSQIFANSPYALITGLSGVGKSTFVLEILSQENCVLYLGRENMHVWATDDSVDKDIILFWDEINLSGDLSILESIMYGFILIDGECYKLTQRHKILGAMNPNSFGGERRSSPFIENHGNACLFTPLPMSVLYEKIFQPILESTFQAESLSKISEYLFSLYDFLCSISEKELLVSPRELQMIAMLTALDPQNAHPERFASYFGYHLMKQVIPSHHQQAFERAFQPLISFPCIEMPEHKDFLLTPSRQAFCQLMNAFLCLRYKRSSGQIASLGGVGGFVVEGEPGIGKSQLVEAYLTTCGYSELRSLDDLPTADTSNVFFKIPAAWSDSDKIDALLKLFDAGCIVIMDESNSGSMLESLLNDLLMGRTKDGRLAIKAGFLLFGIQNPITMPGRRATSNAMNRRLTKVVLPNYSNSEMTDILTKKGMKEEDIFCLIKSYFKQRNHALRHQLTLPTFRDVLRVADQHLQFYTAVFDFLFTDSTEISVEQPIYHDSFFQPANQDTLEYAPKRARIE